MVRTGDGYKSFEPKILQRNFDSLKYHLQTYAEHYKPEHAGQKRNYIDSITEGLNQEGIEVLQNAHREFHRLRQQIMRDEKYKGNIPVFSVSFFDSFTSIDLDEKGEHYNEKNNTNHITLSSSIKPCDGPKL